MLPIQHVIILHFLFFQLILLMVKFRSSLFMIRLNLLMLPIQHVIILHFLFQVSVYSSPQPVVPIFLLSGFLLQPLDLSLGLPAQFVLFLLELVPFILQPVVVGMALSEAFFDPPSFFFGQLLFFSFLFPQCLLSRRFLSKGLYFLCRLSTGFQGLFHHRFFFRFRSCFLLSRHNRLGGDI